MPADTDTPLTAADVNRITSVLESLPHNVKLGVRTVELSRGRCIACIEYRPELVGDPTRGVLHGGVVTTLIDATAGAAVYSSIDMETPIATLDMRVDYLRPTEPRKRLYASAELYRLTRRVAFVRASAYHDDSKKPVAYGIASFMLRSPNFSRWRS